MLIDTAKQLHFGMLKFQCILFSIQAALQIIPIYTSYKPSEEYIGFVL